MSHLFYLFIWGEAAAYDIGREIEYRKLGASFEVTMEFKGFTQVRCYDVTWIYMGKQLLNQVWNRLSGNAINFIN